MLNRMKAVALAAASVTLCSCGGTAPAPPQNATRAAAVTGTNTTVIFGGGYVFAFGAGNKTVDVGAMHVASPSTARHAHPMILAIGKGDWDKSESIPIQNAPESTDTIAWQGWDLTNYEVLIKPGGNDPQETDLTVPAYTVPADPCAKPADPNSWFYVPEITKIAANSQPISTLKDVMMTRIPISRGTLAVKPLAPGCFSFVDPSGTEKRKQLTAHGREGVTYTTSSAALFVDLVLNDVKTGKPVGKIRFKPDAGELVLTINTRLKTVIVPNDPNAMKFFDMYYDLVVDAQGKSLAPKERLTPIWPGGLTPVTPGGECPPISVGYQ